MSRSVLLGGVGVIAALAALSTLTGSWYTVDQSEVAVVTRFGQVTSTSGPGLHFKMPWTDGVSHFPTSIQSVATKARVNTYTIDNQEVDILYTIFYRIPAARAAYLYANNQDYEPKLSAVAVDRLKVAMGQVNVSSVAEKRGELRDRIKATLAGDAAALGLEIVDFQLTDLQYTDAYRTAINGAAVAKAQVESIEYQRQQAEKQAQLAVTRAQGEANAAVAAAKGQADARVLAATADAQAVRLNGEAQAGAIKAQAEALASNAALVELRKAERWDGKLPTALYGSAPIPYLNLGK